MALFKILKGKSTSLPTTSTPGWMYITEDTGDIYVFTSETDRLHLNADKATYLRNVDGTASYDYETIANILSTLESQGTSLNNIINNYNDLKVTLSNDITGSGVINDNTVAISATLKNSGVKAGSYGQAINNTVTHSGSFNIPYITVDSQGRITDASTKIITLPSMDDINSSINEINNNHQAIAINIIGGDITGSASINDNNILIIDNATLATSGVEEGSYGPAESAAPTFEGSFSVPYITVDGKGRITSAKTNTITLPSVDSINSNINTINDNIENLETETTNIRTDFTAADTATLTSAKSYTDAELKTLKNGSIKTIADLEADTVSLTSVVNSNYNALHDAITQEIKDRETAVKDEATARSTGDTNTLASAKEYTDDEIAKVTGTSTSTLETIDTNIANLQSANNTLLNRTITAGNGLTGGGDLSANRTIAIGQGAGISVTADAIALAASGVTANDYGPAESVTPAFEESFSVPYITVDAYGRVTDASTKTITLPSVDSINSSINSLNANISQEIKDRAAADTALEDAYKAADDTLKSNYEAADAAINTIITNLKDGSTKTIADLSDEIGSATNNHNAINIELTGAVTGTGTINSNKITVATSNKALTVGSKTYNGTAAVTITPADLGLSTAIKFLGTTTTAISDGSTTNPITVGGVSTTVTNGNVVLYDGKEFIWTGSLWELFGDEGSYALKTITVSAGTGLTGGGDLTANRTLSLATSGVTAGTYGAASSPSLGGAFAIPSLTVDAYGRVTKAGTVNVTLPAAPALSGGSAAAADATVVGGVTVNGHAVTVSKKTLTAGSNITITGAADKITIAATDTNTTNVIAGNGLTGGGSAASGTGVTLNIGAGTGITVEADKVSLTASGVTAGSYGPTANVTGSDGATIVVPQITVDAYGRVTGVTNRTYTSVNTDTNTDTNVTTAADTTTTKAYVTTCTGAGTGTLKYHTSVYVNHSTGVLMGAAWNDYAEYRETRTEIEPGRVVCENGDDTLSLSIARLQPGANIVSDTFGFAIGETEQSKTPLAVSGRVLAYPYEDRHSYKPGDAVCAGPDGTISKMSREEIMTYPECILGTVSAIPEYETWGEGNVPVNGRIWIKVR